MQRYDIFGSIHKGLRALLYDTALFVQQTDFLNAEPEDKLVEKIQGAVLLLEHHLQTESKFILPVILDFEPGIADHFLQKHQQSILLSGKLKTCLNHFTVQSATMEKAVAGKDITNLFMEFMLFQLELMSKEEDVLNKIFWRYFSDKHIIQLQKDMLQHDCLKHSEILTQWMLRGINDAEAVLWLKCIEETASQEKFQALFAAAEKELPANRYKKLLSSLTEGMMLA